MTLYNMLHGMNAVPAVILSPFLPRRADDFPRFRDIFNSAEDTTLKGDIYVYTRIGPTECWERGERDCECPGCDATRLMQHADCVGSYTDDFDSTYRTFVFRVPDAMRPDWTALQEGRLADLSTAYRERLRTMFEREPGENTRKLVDLLIHSGRGDKPA